MDQRHVKTVVNVSWPMVEWILPVTVRIITLVNIASYSTNVLLMFSSTNSHIGTGLKYSSKLLLQCELQASCNAFSCKPFAWWLKIIKKFTIRSTQWQSVCEWRVLQHNESKVQLYWWFHWQQLWKGKTSFLVSYLAHFFHSKRVKILLVRLGS